MKEIRYIITLSLLVLAAQLLLPSCNRKNELVPNPYIYISSANGAMGDSTSGAATPGTILKFMVRMYAGTEIEELRVQKLVNNQAETLVVKTESFNLSKPDKSTYLYLYEYDYTVQEQSGTDMQLRFTVKDKSGNVKTAFYNLGVGTLLTEHTGRISNKYNPVDSAAFDLVSNTIVPAAAADSIKDMMDNTDSTKKYAKGWTVGASDSTSFFKPVKTYLYNMATAENLQAAYDSVVANNGEVLRTRSGVKVGDVYLARLRQTTQLAVIRITKVVSDDVTSTTGTDKDYLEFTYRKIE